MDLELIATDDLVNEVRRRFDCCVVIAQQDQNSAQEAVYFWMTGSLTTALGLLVRGLDHCKRRLDDPAH